MQSVISDSEAQQAETGIGLAQAFKQHGQFIKQLTKSEYDLILQEKEEVHSNEVFKLTMEKLGFQADINNLNRKCEAFEAMIDLLKMDQGHNEETIKSLKAEIEQLYPWIDDLRKQKEELIEEYDKEKKDLRDESRTLRINIDKQKQRYESLLLESQQKSERQKSSLKNEISDRQKTIKELEQTIKNLIENFQSLNEEYDALKVLIVDQLSPEKKQENEERAVNQNDLIYDAAQELVRLKKERAQLEKYLRLKEKNADYHSYPIQQRVEAVCREFEMRSNREAEILYGLEIFINKLLAENTKKYEQSYGQQLRNVLSAKFIDLNSEIQGLKIEKSSLEGKKCMECEFNIKLLTDQRADAKQKAKDMVKDYAEKKRIIQQECQAKIEEVKRDYALALQNIKKDKAAVESRLNQSTGTINSLLDKNKNAINILQSKHEKAIQQWQSKCQKQASQLQSLTSENSRLKQDLYNENNRSQNSGQQLQSLKSQLKQKQGKIESLNSDILTNSNKMMSLINDIDKFNKGQRAFKEQIADFERQLDEARNALTAKEKELGDKNKELERKLQEKRDEIDEFDNKLCRIVNMKCSGKVKVEVKKYKEAFDLLINYLQHSSSGQIDYSFKIPSISNKFDEHMDWMKQILIEYSELGPEITSRYLGTAAVQPGIDFAKVLDQPNILFICSTKKASFQIFITKLSKTLNERFKVVVFSTEKQLRYPAKMEAKSSLRPSNLNSNGTLALGKAEITINKFLQLTLTSTTGGYFGQIDSRQLFEVEPGQKIQLEAIESYQVVAN